MQKPLLQHMHASAYAQASSPAMHYHSLMLSLSCTAGKQTPKVPRLNITATPEPRPAQPPRRTASSQLLFMPEGPQRPASSYLARDPVSYQNLMIVTGQLDYMDSTDGGTPGRSPGGMPADASPRSSAAGSPRSRHMLPSSTAAKDDASEAGVSDDLHDTDSLHSDDMPGQQATAGICGGACPPMPSSSGSLQQQADCCSSPAQANAAPTALILLLLGILLTLTMDSSSLRGLSFGPQVPSIIVPTWAQLKAGILKAGIAQLPLTTLNSVIAVTALAKELFPTRDASRWSPTTVSIGVGAMNLVGCWFGAMPCCHGAGGLAAQHKFGARWVAATWQALLVRLHAMLQVRIQVTTRCHAAHMMLPVNGASRYCTCTTALQHYSTIDCCTLI